MERESRLKIGCALMTCLTIPLMLCAAAVVFGLGLNLNGVSLPGARASAPAVDRLAVIGEDGNVYVLDRSGQSRVALTTNAVMAQNAAVRRLYAFPNWSPDSEQVAFVGLSSENGGKAS
ncbi:MAG: hypothetical protein HYR71_13090, partial [Chloroflexi bacterium]|nr:hypothetical protein [Chloroflexota bacterium]